MARPRIVSRFDMLPIRWRLAVTSAILTFAILLAFALVIGFFTARQMRTNFDQDIQHAADELQDGVQVQRVLGGDYHIAGQPEIIRLASAGDVVVRILSANGSKLTGTPGAPDLGP